MNSSKVPDLLSKLADFLPAYHRRPQQLELAAKISGAIENQRNLVAEGGTGVGKSMAYLVPAALAAVEDGARVLIATSHKPLQDQLAKKDLPVLARLFEGQGYPPFKFTTLKGISNYLCWHSTDIEREQIIPNPAARQVMNFAQESDEDFSGDFEDFPFNISPETRASLSATSEECLGAKCPYRDRCFALKARRDAGEANIVVTNHALLTLDIGTEGQIIPGDYSLYIVDEGHNFEENATRAYGAQLPLNAVRRFLNGEIAREVQKTNNQHFAEARSLIEKFQMAIHAQFIERDTTSPSNYPDSEDSNRLIYKKEFSDGRILAEKLLVIKDLIKDYLPKNDEELAKKNRLLNQSASLVERLLRVSGGDALNTVFYAERTSTSTPVVRGAASLPNMPRSSSASSYNYSLFAMPIDVSGYLNTWFSDNTVIVTSATLSDGQNFNFFIRRLGMHQPETIIVPSPFNYQQQVRLFLPKSTPPPEGMNLTRQLAQRLQILLNLAPGRALLLFTSHAVMENVWREFSTSYAESFSPPRQFYKQGQAQMGRIIGEFQETTHGVIFGTRSWWQGVDLPGLSLLVMDKLPFPQLNDPLVKARSEEIENGGGNSFGEFMLPLAIITFRQGFGRLMRQEDDRGLIVVFDDRIVTKSYGKRFLNALPPVPVLSSLQGVKQFWNID